MNVHQVTKLVLDCGGSCKQFSGKIKLFNGLRLNMPVILNKHLTNSSLLINYKHKFWIVLVVVKAVEVIKRV